jgi:hypothetical protein
MSRGQETPTLAYRVTPRKGVKLVVFDGEIDDSIEPILAKLHPQLVGMVHFHLEGIRRVNSAGVRSWTRFMSTLADVTELVLTHCSPTVVMQLNMISDFRGPGHVESFYAPYTCDHCGHEESKLLTVADMLRDGPIGRVPVLNCPSCESRMEFDELEQSYLEFLASEAKVDR